MSKAKVLFLCTGNSHSIRDYQFLNSEYYDGTLDCFCNICGGHTVFNRLGKPLLIKLLNN